MNYFVEGLQGSGKSTLVGRLSEKYPDYHPVREGEYSPIELSWCAYVKEEEYAQILEKYSDIRQEIEAKSYKEEDRRVICYTKILTDIPGFHKDLERYEIYNNRVSFDEFKSIVLSRFRKWNGDNMIFECSLFQNIVEDMILFRDMSDREIISFYEEINRELAGKDIHIMYLETDDIAANIDVIRKERSDDKGNELWFPLMIGFFNESPFAVRQGLSGEEGLLEHLKHRQDLELEICEKIFPGRYTVLKSKAYGDI